MTLLLCLPAELFDKTLHELSTQSLAKLSLVNRQLSRTVEPLLYRSIDWMIGNSNLARAEIAHDDSHRIVLLFRSICENPRLISHVQRLRVTAKLDKPTNSLGIYSKTNTISQSDFQLFQDTITADLSDFPHLQKLERSFGAKSVDALLAVLLSRLNNLRALEFHYSKILRLQLTGCLLKHYKSDFTRMHEFSVWIEDREMAPDSLKWDFDYGRTRDLLTFPFVIPTMKTIEIALPSVRKRFPSGLMVVPLPFPKAIGMVALWYLRTLRLLDSQATVGTVGLILKHTPNLEIFEYNFIQDLDILWWDADKTHHYLNEWQELARHLGKVSVTLKELIVSLSFHALEDYKPEEADPVWVFGAWERRGWMEDLKFLTNLGRLEIPWPVLLGFTPDFPNKKLRDVLPENIRELCLRDDLVNTPEDIAFPYQWKYLESTATDNAPSTITEFGPVIEQLHDYFSSGNGTSLNKLVLKHGRDRWQSCSLPAERLGQILQEAGVEGRVHVDLEDGLNTIEDLLIYSPLPSARKVIRFHERRRKTI